MKSTGVNPSKGSSHTAACPGAVAKRWMNPPEVVRNWATYVLPSPVPTRLSPAVEGPAAPRAPSGGPTTEVNPPFLSSDTVPANTSAPWFHVTVAVDTPPITVSFTVVQPSTASGDPKS